MGASTLAYIFHIHLLDVWSDDFLASSEWKECLILFLLLFFPPESDIYVLQGWSNAFFNFLLLIDIKTIISYGLNVFAQHSGVGDLWNQYDTCC